MQSMKHWPLHVHAVNRALKIEMHYEVFGAFSTLFSQPTSSCWLCRCPYDSPCVLPHVELVSLTILDLLCEVVSLCVYMYAGEIWSYSLQEKTWRFYTEMGHCSRWVRTVYALCIAIYIIPSFSTVLTSLMCFGDVLQWRGIHQEY